eukprot:CCRYP_004576-RA/>CCRYP_004576-RA protein AED:0.57 eAED:0.30 QI:0/-1/0/1/-1/1/1/0/161
MPMLPNAPSEPSKPTSSASWPETTPPFQTTFGTLLRQSTIAPAISAWEYFNGPLNYDATPLGPTVALSSSTTKPPHGNHGTSVAETASALDPPYTTTNASKLWTLPPTVSSSQTQSNSATAISSNPPSPTTTAFSMQSTTYPLTLAPTSSLDSQLQAITAL